MGGARSMVSEVEASPLFGTSTVFSIEDPASLDFGCSEIKRRNSSMLQSIETKFAIFFSKLMFFALGHDTDRKAGRNTPIKACSETCGNRPRWAYPHSGRRRLPGEACRPMSGAFAGAAKPQRTADEDRPFWLEEDPKPANDRRRKRCCRSPHGNPKSLPGPTTSQSPATVPGLQVRF